MPLALAAPAQVEPECLPAQSSSTLHLTTGFVLSTVRKRERWTPNPNPSLVQHKPLVSCYLSLQVSVTKGDKEEKHFGN